MRLHDRYLFRELLTPLAFCFGGFAVFCFFILFSTSLEKIQESKLNLPESLAYCFACLPGFLVPILPLLLLLALLIALTHHARYNEITALRAAGVSLWRVCAPYFAVGLLASGLYFGLNELVVPAADRWAARILERHPDTDPLPARGDSSGVKMFYNSHSHRLWRFADYDPRTTRMRNPNVSWTARDGSTQDLQADYALHTNGVWTFFNVTVRYGRSGQTNFPAVLRMPQFDESPETIRRQIKFTDAQTLSGLGSPTVPLLELCALLRHNPGLSAAVMQRLQTDFFGRLAAPWTCLVVVLMAIPFGAQTGRRNLFFGVAGCLFIGFAYFVLQHVSLALGSAGQLPAWLAAWLPNLLFAAAGLILILRVR